VGRGDSQEAQDLLDVIKERLFPSSLAVFDATGGNANVSLEFGLAEANEIPCAKTANKMTAIPADMVTKVKAASRTRSSGPQGRTGGHRLSTTGCGCEVISKCRQYISAFQSLGHCATTAVQLSG